MPKKRYFTKEQFNAGNTRRQAEWRERQRKLTEERLKQKAAAFAAKVKAWEQEQEKLEKAEALHQANPGVEAEVD